MTNPFNRGTLYNFYFDQLMNRKRPPNNEVLHAAAEKKFGRPVSIRALRVFRSKLKHGTFGSRYDVPGSER